MQSCARDAESEGAYQRGPHRDALGLRSGLCRQQTHTQQTRSMVGVGVVGVGAGAGTGVDAAGCGCDTS